MDGDAITLQIKILTGFVGFLAVLVGAGLAYLRLYTANALHTATTELKKEFDASNDKLLDGIQREFARKEIIDEKLAGMDRRLTRTEARTDAMTLPRTLHEPTQ